MKPIRRLEIRSLVGTVRPPPPSASRQDVDKLRVKSVVFDTAHSPFMTSRMCLVIVLCYSDHLREARFDASDALVRAHCGHASKSGGGVCSDTATVSEFCSFFVENCEDDRWGDVPSCVVDAVKFAKGDPGSSARNTLECRACKLLPALKILTCVSAV